MVLKNNYQKEKKAFQPVRMTKEQLEELKRCKKDPVYFMEKFMQVQHPTRGKIPFKLYDYQKRMVWAYTNNRKCIALTARQMGKCSTQETCTIQDGVKVKIGSLLGKYLSFREKIVNWLEEKLVSLAVK